MRKLMSAVVAMFLMAGLVAAAEVMVVKYDKEKKEVTVKEGDKEATYTISDKTKVTVGDKEGKFEDLEKRLTSKVANKMKLDITTDKGAITEVKLKGGKK
ncbi:unnamed protein product [Gemmataceae bacterium]|nr:unnamed protein product [Gemmataceae bacterium]VTU00179.1 unnamed protein product [Gemmataceae bacterium]